ncbi:pyrroloquinoline quinone biosynthesis protein PqqB [Rhizobium sp. NXC24]|uniref:pyrroloquinoline quinone biosynthesis protein PqqB n=1 Tax=Rhizobium sp. NXC24 TaxID=2048897 RepID=UPI001FE0F4DE|nr:pyrroloquinoline quinone biosynthesis protein PqqB [Rhizobium sp. NXC24]
MPQWNCGCPTCVAARLGDLAPQTQASLAVSVDGRAWLVVDASPDICQQLRNQPELWPQELRDSPFKSIMLTSGDIDHVAGLLTLREKQPFELFATRALLETLEQNPIYGVLDPLHVRQNPIELETPFFPLDDLEARLFAVAGKVPLYLEKDEPELGVESEQTVGVEFRIGAQRVLYIPGCGGVSVALADRIAGAELLFFDGTVFTDDEMIRMGTGQKTGRRMGHVPISGPGGSLEALSRLPIGRCIYIHVNNTNPVWRAGAERAQLERHGFAVGYDGMEVTLATGCR